MNSDFFLRRIELINCIAACNNSEEKEKKSAEQIKIKCIKTKKDEQIIEEIVKNLEFKEAMQFTIAEMNFIRHSQNSRAMVGAGIQSAGDQALGTDLLESASASESPTGLSLLSLINRYFFLESNEKAKINLSEKLRANIIKLLQTRPDNALSYYLNGYRLHLDNKDNEALLLIKDGNEKEFTDYSKERFFAVVDAAESIGYSPFTARNHAINYSSPTEPYPKLLAACKALIKSDKEKDARKACLSMGEKIESSSRGTFEKIQGLMIQSRAVRDSADPKDIELMGKISEKQRMALENSPKLAKIPFSEVPEPIWLQYFEIYFSQDERAASSFIEDYYKKTKQGYGKQ